MYTAASGFNVLAWKCQLHATWCRRRIYTYKKRWRQQNMGRWGGGCRGVVTQFFILRQGLKECAGIVKSAASELLSPFSSFFSPLFSTARISICCRGSDRIRIRIWIQSNAFPKCTNLGARGFLRVLFSITICIPVAPVFTAPRWNRELDT